MHSEPGWQGPNAVRSREATRVHHAARRRSAAAGPLTARAQPRERLRRIGVLLDFAADDPAGQSRLTTFLQGLAQVGWTEGRNARIDIRWGAGTPSAFAGTRRN